MTDRQKIEDLTRRRAGMDAEYNDWKPHFQELREFIMPTRGRMHIGERRSSSTLNKKIIDGTARRGMRTLRAGLMAGITSPSRPWFRLTVKDSDAMAAPDVKEWAHEVEKRMYAILSGSNIYRTLDACYGDLGLYGTFTGLIVSDFNDVVHSHALPMGLARIAEGPRGIVDTMHRDCRMTVKQMVDKFGLDKVSTTVKSQYANNDHHSYHTIKHAIEPRGERDPMSPLSTDKPFASYYWQDGEDNLLEESGFGVNPILSPRWERTEGETYATHCPGMEVLGDAVQLQQQHKDKALAIQKMHNPPLQGGSGVAQSQNVRNIPGGVTTANVTDLQKGGLRPLYEVRPDVGALMADIEQTQYRIDQGFFVDLFLMTASSDRRQITAREVAERHEEKLLVLGPVLESLDHALLQPLIEATFHHMLEADLVPTPPQRIAGAALQVDYTSVLAQAQKALGVAAMERTIGFAATLEQMKPGSMDLIDADQAIRDFADQVGPPPAMIHTPEEVSESRQARAEQQQQQQAIEAAQPLANAAKLVSEASARGDDKLQQAGLL